MIGMVLDGISEEMSLLYLKAKDAYDKCIEDENNAFLKKEVKVSLSEISVIEKDIKIVFSKRNFNIYVFEVTLLLFDGHQEIGKYLYITDHRKQEIDDFLVFYE